MEPGLASTWPRSTSSFLMPRSNTPTFSPARASLSNLRNISRSVAVVFCTSRRPTISTSSILLMIPRSTRPVTTVPRPSMLNTSSMHIKNGLSTSRSGSGIAVSQASSSSPMALTHFSSPSSAPCEAQRTIGVSAGKSYFVRRSLISSSTNSSISSSSTRSHLFSATTSAGTPT